MDLAEIYTHEYEEFVSDILRLFEIQNQATTRPFRYLKNKMSKRIFSKKFSKLFQTAPNLELASLLSDALLVISSLAQTSQQFSDELVRLKSSLVDKDSQVEAQKLEFERDIRRIQRANEALEAQLSLVENKSAEQRTQAERRIRELGRTAELKQARIDELLVQVTLKDSQLDAHRQLIETLRTDVKAGTLRMDKLTREFEWFCEVVSSGRGDRGFLRKGLQRTGQDRLIRLWSGTAIRKVLFEFLDEQDLKVLEGVSKKVGLVLRKDAVLGLVRANGRVEGRRSNGSPAHRNGPLGAPAELLQTEEFRSEDQREEVPGSSLHLLETTGSKTGAAARFHH